MGYSTRFDGELNFTSELTGEELATLTSILGEDVRNHPEWALGKKRGNFFHINLEVLDDRSGIEWNGSEKSYDMVGQVNTVIRLMRRIKPEFGLEGELWAQGEDVGDRWMLIMEEGVAVKKKRNY